MSWLTYTAPLCQGCAAFPARRVWSVRRGALLGPVGKQRAEVLRGQVERAQVRRVARTKIKNAERCIVLPQAEEPRQRHAERSAENGPVDPRVGHHEHDSPRLVQNAAKSQPSALLGLCEALAPGRGRVDDVRAATAASFTVSQELKEMAI